MKPYSRAITAVGIIIAFIGLVSYQLSQFATDASLSHWYSNASGYQAALDQQQKSGKPVALFFHTDWCSSCKNLRETVLSSRQFEQFSAQLIPVKINPEMGLNEKKIADSYGVRGYPTFLIITGNSPSVARIKTMLNMPPEKFIRFCREALNI